MRWKVDHRIDWIQRSSDTNRHNERTEIGTGHYLINMKLKVKEKTAVWDIIIMKNVISSNLRKNKLGEGYEDLRKIERKSD